MIRPARPVYSQTARNGNLRRRLLAATLALSVSCGLALAHSGATGIVKQRMDAMKDIAAQMKLIGAMVRAERD